MKFYTNVCSIGNTIYTREVNNGCAYSFKEEYKPSLFVPSKNKTGYKSLDNKYLEKIDFLNIKDYKEFIEKYKDVSNFSIYGDINPVFSYICDNYPNDIDFDMKHIKILTIDIETESENGFPKVELTQERVNLITLKQFNSPFFFTFGLGDFTPQNKFQNYLKCNDEYELLEKFLSFLDKMQPDVITGWNVRFFDIPYLVGRINKILGEGAAKRLSFWKYIREKIVILNGKENKTYDLYGTSIIDYYEIYKKNVLEPRESYTLDFIAETELGENKIPFDGSFHEFYTHHHQKFVEYNIQDTYLVDKLEAKLKLIELTLSVAYFGHVNYIDVLSQVRTWDTIIYNYLKNKNIIVPQKKTSLKEEQFVGAYVKNPKVGFHKWVVSFDVNSLYPSIIRFLNIGVESKTSEKRNFIIDSVLQTNSYDYDKDYTIGCNGVTYRKDKVSFYSELVEKLFNDRVKFRKLAKDTKKKIKDNPKVDNLLELQNLESKYDLKQKTMKIQLNSLYGALGNEYFRFFDLENAMAVTTTGQFIIRYVGDKLNEFMNKLVETANHEYVIYIDTDSVVGETLIYVNNEKIKIEDYYNKLSNNLLIKNDILNENYVKQVYNDKSYGLDEFGNLKEKNINYIMKHKVKKRMFKITVSGKEVIVTEDHSVIVKRNEKYLSVKPSMINMDTDTLVFINN